MISGHIEIRDGGKSSRQRESRATILTNGIFCFVTTKDGGNSVYILVAGSHSGLIPAIPSNRRLTRDNVRKN